MYFGPKSQPKIANINHVRDKINVEEKSESPHEIHEIIADEKPIPTNEKSEKDVVEVQVQVIIEDLENSTLE